MLEYKTTPANIKRNKTDKKKQLLKPLNELDGYFFVNS